MIKVQIIKEVYELISSEEMPGNRDIVHTEKSDFHLAEYSRIYFKGDSKTNIFHLVFWDPIMGLDIGPIHDEWRLKIGVIDKNKSVIADTEHLLRDLKNCSLAFPDSIQQINIVFKYNSMRDLEAGDPAEVIIRTSSSFSKLISFEFKPKLLT